MVGGDEVIDYVTFSYMLASSLWLTNIHWLERDVHRMAFKDIRMPSVQLNDRLHDRREDLVWLGHEVHMANAWSKPQMELYLEKLRKQYSPSPRQFFEDVLVSAAALERFHLETFQLLVSSISVLDSQTGIEQGKRGARLTQLATIYVPLSFVTGLFGMNIREINGSPEPAWVAVVSLVIVAICTLLLLYLANLWDDGVLHRLDKTFLYLRRTLYEAAGIISLGFSLMNPWKLFVGRNNCNDDSTEMSLSQT